MRQDKEITDLLASIRSGIARNKKEAIFDENEVGCWKLIIRVLEWIKGSEDKQIEDIKDGL